MPCTRKFFIRELYKRKVFFSFDNFVIWNWFNKSIINIIRTAVVAALRSLNNRFMFMIFAFYNIFFLSSLQFEQKSSTCLTVMYFSSHRQCAIKTSKTYLSCRNLLKSNLFIFNWIMSALCVFERPTYIFKWRWLIFGVSLRYWTSFILFFYLLFQFFRDETRMRLIRVAILWWKHSDESKIKLYAFSVALSIISLFSISAWLKI